MAVHPSKSDDQTDDRDNLALELRRTGRSFAFIARTLSLGRARDANAAFLRALENSPASERKQLRTEELGRLKQLEETIKSNATLAPFDRDRQLQVVKQLRTRLAG